MNLIIGIIASVIAIFCLGTLSGINHSEERIKKECSKYAQVSTEEYNLVCFRKPIERK